MGWNVLDAGGLDAPVVAVQDHEDRQERLGPLRIETEIVDLIVRSAAHELLLLVHELSELHDAVHVDDFSPRHLAEPG